MPSPNDNISMKDALSFTFKMRAKDRSIAQDGSLQSIRHLSESYPIDYGTGGCFQLASKSSTMAAGLAANSPIYSFRWTSTTLLGIVRRVRLLAGSLAIGFAQGTATFDMFVCRSWTVADTGGVTDTLITDNGNLRTAMPATVLSEIRHSSTATLTAGTRTKDVQPVDTLFENVGTVANTGFIVSPNGKLFEKFPEEHPLVFVQNEGFTIQATVPATGTWQWTIITEWDEVPLVNY